jgi:hypothetical protein
VKWLLWLLVAFVALRILGAVLRWGRRWRDPRPEEAKRVRRGKGLGIDELARRLDMGPRELQAFAPSYREARIPKRSGGTRRLLIPDDRTKALQRRILRRLFDRLRAHPAAMGFEPGKSIVYNALPHVGRAVVVKLDVVNFFPSTTADRLDAYFRRIGWDEHAAALLVRLTAHENGLPQGAPTSPRLSNLVNFQMDSQLAALAARRRGSYTRYADDITFSFPEDRPPRVRGAVQHARAILAANGYLMHGRRKLSIRRAPAPGRDRPRRQREGRAPARAPPLAPRRPPPHGDRPRGDDHPGAAARLGRVRADGADATRHVANPRGPGGPRAPSASTTSAS